jgi:hypothetical protein
MTQAFNLSQLANKVNTSGNLDASTALYNQVPVANGGTGKSTVTSGALLVGAGTSAMTELVGSTPGQAVVWNGTTFTTGTVAGAADGINVYVAPGTWTKPSGLLQVKVTVVGAGGNGGSAPTPTNGSASGGGSGGASIRWIPAVTIPGPVSVTAGAGTNSFGAFASATAGAAGSGNSGAIANGGAGGSGTSGTINIAGNRGGGAFSVPGQSYQISGAGAPSILGIGGNTVVAGGVVNGTPGSGYGGGGSGSVKQGAGTSAGGTGAPGIVIVEEFY